MNLNEHDIYNSLESYRNKMGYSQEKMAELVGLATKQTYANMIKNKTMKFSYFINLINNTGLSSDYFLNISTRKEQQAPIIPGTTPGSAKKYGEVAHHNMVNDEKLKYYSCLDCIQKEEKIKDLRENINDLRKHIALLELGLGKSLKSDCG